MTRQTLATRRAIAQRSAQRQAAATALNGIVCFLVPVAAVAAVAALFVAPALARIAAVLPLAN